MRHILYKTIHYITQKPSFQHHLDLRMYLDGGASGDICCLSPILKTITCITVCWLHDVELSFAVSGFASAPAHDSASYSTCAPMFPVIVCNSFCAVTLPRQSLSTGALCRITWGNNVMVNARCALSTVILKTQPQFGAFTSSKHFALVTRIELYGRCSNRDRHEVRNMQLQVSDHVMLIMNMRASPSVYPAAGFFKFTFLNLQWTWSGIG